MCLPETISIQKELDRAFRATVVSYLLKISSGGPKIERHARAQKAYAPWASDPGLPEIPPSNVWPKGEGQHISSLAVNQTTSNSYIVRDIQEDHS